MSSVKLSFHGAVQTVTGSCHLLQVEGLKVLIDCGLFQGSHKMDEMNYDHFGFEPAEIDYLLLTHGHLDHCGRIPVLVSKGFKGKIICTPATYDIAKIVMMDSAQIQEEDAEHLRRLGMRKGFTPKKPLYTVLEAIDSLKYFRDIAQYDKPVKLGDKVSATFRDAGHILGASFIELEIRGYKRIVFSGDLGNRNKPVVRDPSFSRDADIVVVESTYGDRNHKCIEDSIEEFYDVIVETFKRGGNVIIPSFAVERAQELLFILREFYDAGRLPRCNVYLDSPMGISVTNIMRRHPECLDTETLEMLRKKDDPFSFPSVEFTRTQDASRQINNIKNNAIVIAGSGMCTGGRIKQHLKHNIWRKECSVVFMGFQVEGTLGREIVDGAKEVRIYGELYRVNAQVHTIGGFSSHADKDILLEWLGKNTTIERVFLVHGEPTSLKALESDIRVQGLAKEINIPHMHQRYTV